LNIKGWDMNNDEFKILLKKAGLSKKKLAEVANISPNTANMWGSVRPVPSWVEPFIINYIKAKTLDSVKDVICTDKKADNE